MPSLYNEDGQPHLHLLPRIAKTRWPSGRAIINQQVIRYFSYLDIHDTLSHFLLAQGFDFDSQPWDDFDDQVSTRVVTRVSIRVSIRVAIETLNRNPDRNHAHHVSIFFYKSKPWAFSMVSTMVFVSIETILKYSLVEIIVNYAGDYFPIVACEE